MVSKYSENYLFFLLSFCVIVISLRPRFCCADWRWWWLVRIGSSLSFFHSSCLPFIRHQSRSVKFLLNSMLLWCPDKCRTSSCSVSNHIEQKQQLNRPFASGVLIILRCTEHKCLSKWAFCLNIATHNRHANAINEKQFVRIITKHEKKYWNFGFLTFFSGVHTQMGLQIPWHTELFATIFAAIFTHWRRIRWLRATGTATRSGARRTVSARLLILNRILGMSNRIVVHWIWCLYCSYLANRMIDVN